MILKNLVKDSIFEEIKGDINVDISDICYDSRNVKKNSIFICLCGSNFDGHDYINDALNNGAVAVVVQKEINIPNVAVIKVKDSRKFLSHISAVFFDYPSKELTTIGITGTKGKTTTSFMIKSILEEAGIKTGVIGTIGAVYGDNIVKLNNTTPESYEIQKNVRKMVEDGCKCVVLEASSIGLKTHRLDDFNFDFGVFTNFSSDHIGDNEHRSLQEYLECKSMLFSKCKIGFINIDDENSSDIIKNHTCKIKTFGIKRVADYYAKNIRLFNKSGNIGVKCDVCEVKGMYIPVPGEFNVYNALAAYSVCKYMGISDENIRQGICKFRVKGRVEPFKVSEDYAVFIDYAHNALSMESILKTMRKYNPNRLIIMFGAGGNRPKIRRYEMGETAGNLADLSVITSDNPRFEEPLEIINDIKKGIEKTDGKYIIVENRKEAIKYCLENSQKGDIIILAGKGHEDYQEIEGIKYPFDERAVIENIIKKSKRGNVWNSLPSQK